MKMDIEETKVANRAIKHPGTTEKLNDIGFRLVLIPFFGIAIPLVTGMVDHSKFTNWEIKFSYLYTILLAFIIWHGNRYLLFTLRSYFNWFNKPVKKIIALLLAVTFYTIPISILFLIGWYHIFSSGLVNWNVVSTSSLIIMICVIFITHVYETVFLVKDSENEMIRNEQLEQAKAQVELEALKNQIDPHFIFNSLNTLSHLIDENSRKARQFNDSLADVYRYILQNKSRDLVLLKEEIDFLLDYFSLLKIRFEDAVRLEINIDPSLYEQYLLPPISLQILIENAIKHNEFSDALPLVMELSLKDEQLTFHNVLYKRKLRKVSSKIGLLNLNERYKLATNKSITVQAEEKDFTVWLPVLKIA